MISRGPLEDRLAIRELVESYNDAVMRRDAGAWAENWADDGVWSLPRIGEVRGKSQIVATWEAAMSQHDVNAFFASAGPIVVDGHTAHGTWYQQELLTTKGGVTRTVVGEYTDDYVKSAGRWYFQQRVYQVRISSESVPG